MAAWETEDEMAGPALPVLTPTKDARRPRSSRTASRSSKRSRRSVTPPGKTSPSPPPVPGSDKTDKSDRILRDLATDEKISILDPRRFTPTLHASLVSEILALRRDQEEKNRVIERLESTLQSTREKEDSVQTTLASTAKENRSLKRQLTLLEGGTSSALSELARERDEAVDAAAETKKRLETAQKKLKTQEEDSERTYDQWGKDKDEWEVERRNMERKVHIAETRLKTILEEVAAWNAAQRNAPIEESENEDKRRDSDSGSVRSMSIRDSLRFSLINKPNGHSLADELDFDDDSDCTETNGRDSIMSIHRHMRNDSRASVMSRSHRRHNSSDSLIRPGSVVRGRFQTQMQLEGKLANGIIQEMEEPLSPSIQKVSYTDTGVQYSPPPSPKLAPTKPTPPLEPTGVSALKARWENHHEAEATEANQRRKRVSVTAKPLSIQPPTSQNLMVSTAAQTMDAPLSPPKTPKTPSREQPSTPPAAMMSVATQTNLPEPSALPRPTTPPSALTIPSIAIHPPTNRPSSPKKPLLPQQFKDFGCQVSLADVPTSSVGVQTEEIRVDQRLDRLPAHLHPSAIISRPTSPAVGTEIPTDPDRIFTPVPGNLPPRNPRRLTSQRSLSDIATSPRPSTDLETKDTSPGNNEDGPVSPKSVVRRPQRISSLFASFDAASSGDEMDDFDEAHMSDPEYRTALTAPRPVKSPEPGRNTPSPAPTSSEELISKIGATKNPMRPLGTTSELLSSTRLSKGIDEIIPARTGSKGHLRGSGIGAIRKAAMIQSGIATHQEDSKDPPFPIPTRASSRKPAPFGSSLPSEGNRSPTRTDSWRNGRHSHYRANSIRKSRSAAAVPYGKGRNRRRNSRSPTNSPEIPDTPTIPPLPRNGLTTPKNERGRGRGHRYQPSTNTATTEATGFQSNASSQAGGTGVVGAIAQTMVGEWMFKYVRRRKSFGMGNDNVSKDDSSNDRHKRWVWLAPYERAILWSSKQPSSGSALLGKSGRKLTIQSVLDVKDDNPAPKGEASVFNRSILILTPQRALKFTAVNAERHYLWLTSLSFLAHSQQQVPEIPAPVVSKAPDFEPPQNQAKTRRPRIRDSIRLAKGHNNNNTNKFSRLGGAEAGLILSQLANGDNQAAPMPSLPDVPASLISGYRSPVPPVGTESVASGYSNPSKHSNMSHQRDWSRDAAEPPSVPRFQDRDRPLAVGPVHGRKRSNTGGHIPPPLSFRGFSSPSQHAPTNSQSTGTGSSDLYYNPSNNSNSAGYENGPVSAGLLSSQGWGGMSVVSGRTSEASNRTTGANFFDAIGTMRMEAFISPLAFSRHESDMNFPDPLDDGGYAARRRNKEVRRRRSRSRHRGGERDSYSSRGTGGRDYYSGSRTAGEEEYSREDPFKGF